MADSTLRRLARRALNDDDPDLKAREIVQRLRAGMLPRRLVVYASHLGDPIARIIEPDPRIVIDCGCKARREQRTSRVRQPTPLRETPRQCFRCRGSEQVVLSRGLIDFVQKVTDVPHRLLIGWAADMAERHVEAHQPKERFHGRYRLPSDPVPVSALKDQVLPAVRAWLQTGQHDPLIYQHANVNAASRAALPFEVALATMVALADVEAQEGKVRFRAAGIATACYHASHMSREERTWQERHLIKYLLGYLE